MNTTSEKAEENSTGENSSALPAAASSKTPRFVKSLLNGLQQCVVLLNVDLTIRTANHFFLEQFQLQQDPVGKKYRNSKIANGLRLVFSKY